MQTLIWSLKVCGPWAAAILAGRKTVETSGQPCTRNGAAPGWVLLKDDTGTAAGAALLGARFTYRTAAEFAADYKRHRVPASDPFAFGRRATTYGFPVLAVIRFAAPVPVRNLSRGMQRLKRCAPVAVPAC